MKLRSAVLKAAIAASILSMTNAAMAGGTQTIAVSANVISKCTVTTPNATLAFGPLDPVVGGTVNAVYTSATGFKCTNGAPYSVSSDDGLWFSSPGGANNRMKLSSAADCSTATNCIRYTLTSVTSGTGAGMSTNISFAVTGQTTTADYQNAAFGNYADTVILTVVGL